MLFKFNKSILEQFKARDRLIGVMQNTAILMFLINRKNAPNAGIYMTQQYCRLIDHPKLLALDDVAHWPQWQSPDQIIQKFINVLSI